MKKFLDWYASLAPEGETMLIVHQKEKKTGGWYYVAKWPREWKSREAMYGNTGSFIAERMGERPAAQTRFIERVAVMVLDDIGTKSKTPPLAPTWRMETSPGNEQWGYVFSLDDQPAKAEFVGAIRAIANAGYSDPGATNAVRNFRLPGSVNLKPGKNEFAARLIEWHQDREFTLPGILSALGVDPEPPVSMPDPVALTDDGNDRVVKWLAERNQILDPPNSAGWMGVQCPNCEAHSDGNLEGRYSPATRAYKCMHAHCQSWDSETYLKWVAAEGGPVATPGLRDELLAEALAPARAHIQPSEAFPDRVAAAVAEVERRATARSEKGQWGQKFAYVVAEDGYFNIDQRRVLSRASFNALFRHVHCLSIHAGSNGNRRRIEASICFDENRIASGAYSVDGQTYAAGESAILSRNEETFANKWKNSRMAGVPGDVRPWLHHVAYMIPDPAEREHVLNVMAYKLQHPRRKVNHAVLHHSIAGAGKDLMWAPFFDAIAGKNNPRENVRYIHAETLDTQWGYNLECEVLVLNELRQSEASDRRFLENWLKPIIAAPPEMLVVNRKGQHPYLVHNRMLVVAFSNFRNAIALPEDDRRWFVVWSEAPQMPQEDAKPLWDWLAAGGTERVAAWLYARDVSMFSPGAVPWITDAKRALMNASMSSAEAHLVDAIQNKQGEFARGVIASPFQLVVERAQGHMPPGVRLHTQSLLLALSAAGWIDLGMVKSADYQTKKHVFAAREMTRLHTKSELRRLVEQPPGVPFTVIPGGKG